MVRTAQIRFIKKVPETFLERAGALLSGTSFMGINLEALRLQWGERPLIEGKGSIWLWFWDPRQAARRVLHLSFGDGLVAASPAEEWFDISMLDPAAAPARQIELGFGGGATGLLRLQLLCRRHAETLTTPDDIRRYSHFFKEENSLPDVLLVEHDVVERLVFQLEGGRSLILEREDQIGVFKLYVNDDAQLEAIWAEVASPEWGRVEVVEVSG
ncbi:MAG: hypothetical protein IT260_00600 [Saprospiraceae bacterium]|nr:hypothetical protein [Saprospiraceae bacterium]